MSEDAFATIQAETKAQLGGVANAITPPECERCGARIHLDHEDEVPMTDEDGDDICEECYTNNYEFLCSWCEEYEHIDYQHVLLIVFDAEEASLMLPGLYQIVRTPYAVQEMIGSGWIDRRAVAWLGFLPALKEDPYGFPCGHLCRSCQTKALADAAYETRCGALAVLHA